MTILDPIELMERRISRLGGDVIREDIDAFTNDEIVELAKKIKVK